MLPQDMMSGSDPRDMQRRMPGYPPPSQMSGYTGPGGGGASYPPQMGWPPGQHDSAKWNQSVPNYNSQPGHKNFGGHELSSNVYIEGEEPEDEQSVYPNSSYECGKFISNLCLVSSSHNQYFVLFNCYFCIYLIVSSFYTTVRNNFKYYLEGVYYRFVKGCNFDL